MERCQEDDTIVSSAISQLRHTNQITQGQFKNQVGMTIREGLLCRGSKVVIPKAMRQEAISLVHSMGHPGVDKTTRLVRSRFFWKRMDSDIEEYCRGCLICHKNKPNNNPKEKLIPIDVAKSPRETIAIDVATLPWASSNHRYFLLMVDLFSKFVELYPMSDQESSTIIRGILDCWVYRHGPPNSILSDQGPNVDGSEIRSALAVHGIKKKRSSPYHPEGDGQSERGIQAIKQIMRCMLEERQVAKDSWPTILPEVSYIMNSIPNKSTGFSPYRVMYGVEPKPLSDVYLELNTREGYDSVLDWVTELELMEDMINDEVGENLTQARANMKNYFDKGKADSKIRIGDLVLLKNQNRKSSLDQKFDGPYAVIHRKVDTFKPVQTLSPKTLLP